MSAVKKLTIAQMTSMDQLIEASEYTKFSLQDLVHRAAELAKSEQEYNDFVSFCRGYDRKISAGSWSKSAPTVNF